MSRLLLPAAASSLLLAAAGCAGLDSPEERRRDIVVEAEGWAPVDGGNALTARHRALAEAQKKAVEKAVGVTLKAQTKVADAVTLRQMIEANLGGTIRRYEVLSEKEDEGFRKVRIRATVLYRPPDRSPARLRPTRFWVELPNDRAAGALRGALASSDFPLSEGETKADIVVKGVVETYSRSDPRLGGFHSFKARLTLNVVDLRSGQVIERSEEATAVDPDARAAEDMALERAGQSAGLALAAAFEGSAVAGGPPPATNY